MTAARRTPRNAIYYARLKRQAGIAEAASRERAAWDRLNVAYEAGKEQWR